MSQTREPTATAAGREIRSLRGLSIGPLAVVLAQETEELDWQGSEWLSALSAAMAVALLVATAIFWVRASGSLRRGAARCARTATVAAGVLCALALAVVASARQAPWESTQWLTAASVAAACVALSVTLELWRALLGFCGRVGAIAGAVLEQASRSRAIVVFASLICLLPLLPFALTDAGGVAQQARVFLGFGFGALTFLVCAATLLLACVALSSELEARHVHFTAVKPVPAAIFLAGKWLGSVAVGVTLLAVGCLALFLVARWQFVAATDDAAVARGVEREVLSARRVVEPLAVRDVAQRVDAALAAWRESDPAAIRELGRQSSGASDDAHPHDAHSHDVHPHDVHPHDVHPHDVHPHDVHPHDAHSHDAQAAASGAQRNDTEERELELGLARARELLTERLRLRDRSVRPGERVVFRFEGVHLPPARETGRESRNGRTPSLTPLALRYRVSLIGESRSRKARVRLQASGLAADIELRAATTGTVPLPASVVRADGSVELAIENRSPDGDTLLFLPDGGLALVHDHGGFAANVLRSALVVVAQLGFLAMVGILAATELGFGVAALVSLVVWFLAAASRYLAAASVETAHGHTHGHTPGALESFHQWLASSIGSWLAPFTACQPVTYLTDGVYLSWSRVLPTVLWVGIVWTAIVALAAIYRWRRRELARVQV